MKNLKEYVIETLLKDKFKMIPFDLFERYINNAVIDGQYDDCEEYYEVLQVFVDNFGSTPDSLKYFKCFVAWCEQFFSMGVSIKEFYDMFGRLKWENMSRLVGAGSYGAVFGKDNDKVIKMFFQGMTKKDKEFYSICKNHPEIKVFPTVYAIGNNWVMMERLDVDSKKVNKYNEYIFRLRDAEKHLFDGHVISDYISHIAKKEPIPPKFLSELRKDKTATEIWKWIEEVNKVCRKYLSSELQMNWLDWHPGNFGQRKNGDIVFFDV